MEKSCYLFPMCFKYKSNKCSGKGDCKKYPKVDILLNASQLPLMMRNPTALTVPKVDEDAYRFLNNWRKNVVENVDNGKSLYIYSSGTGNGKTTWATKILIEYISKTWLKSSMDCKVLFIDVSRFMLELKSCIGTEDNNYIATIKRNVYNCDLVIWDDIATKCATEYEKDILLSIINYRVNNNKSNIFTSNMDKDRLYEFLDKRLASRIIGSSDLVEFKSVEDRRIYK